MVTSCHPASASFITKHISQPYLSAPLPLVSSGEAVCYSSLCLSCPQFHTISHDYALNKLSAYTQMCFPSMLLSAFSPWSPGLCRKECPCKRFTTSTLPPAGGRGPGNGGSHLSIFHVCQDKKRLATHLELRNFLVLPPWRGTALQDTEGHL